MLRAKDPDLLATPLGRKLSDLVRQTGAFDMDQPDGRAVRIRVKSVPVPRGSGRASAGSTARRPQSA